MPHSLALDELIRKQVLPRFPLAGEARIARLAGGLINHTFLIEMSGGGRAVLQRVNPLFPPAIHDNIMAVTLALQRAGLVTPVLIPTNEGHPFLQLADTSGGPPLATWRLMTYVDGTSFDVLAGPAQAHAAGGLVARFHAALDALPHQFVGLRAGVHDTGRHLAHLDASVRLHAGHRLLAQVLPLAEAVTHAAATLPPLPDLAPRVCHGDLKFNNVLFAGAVPPLSQQAVCLIDLDTVGPMPLAFEMGDAWRSWCNRSGENQVEAELDLALFQASLAGYLEGLGRSLSADERRALLLGAEWTSLELSARFAADALCESYFGWDSQRFEGRGEHNLVRARGQFSLFEQFVAARPERAHLLGI